MNLRDLFEQKQYYYHITRRDALPNIKRQGILPQDASGDWQKSIGYKSKTFLTSQINPEVINEILAMFSNKYGGPEVHENWTDKDWNKFEKDHVLLTIDATKAQINIKKDPNASDWIYSIQTQDRIAPESIIKVQDVAFDWDWEDENQ